MDQERRQKKGFALLLTFLVGILLGAIATVLVPGIVGPYMPEGLRDNEPIEGQVLTKGMEQDRLLLRITSEEGVMLATFTQKQKEIDLLIENGDTVTLRVAHYQPFLEDPIIERVKKSP
jgi:hypothetical protein